MDGDVTAEEPEEVTPGNAARVLSVLLVTAEDDLEGFRIRMLGRDSKLSLERLGAMREVLLSLGEVLFGGDDARWQAIFDARDELRRDDEREAVGQAPAATSTPAPPPQVASQPAAAAVPPADVTAPGPVSTPPPAPPLQPSTPPESPLANTSVPPQVSPLPPPAVSPPPQPSPPVGVASGPPPPPADVSGSPWAQGTGPEGATDASGIAEAPPAPAATPWDSQQPPADPAVARADDGPPRTQPVSTYPSAAGAAQPEAGQAQLETMDDGPAESQAPEALPFKSEPAKPPPPPASQAPEALPFKSEPAKPPPPPAMPAGQQAPIPDFGSTVAAGVVSPMAVPKALPFGDQGSPASTVPLDDSGASGDIPEMSIQQYASLFATNERFPERVDETLKRWGIKDREVNERLHARWRAAMEADGELRERFTKLVADYAQWLEREGKYWEGSR